MKLVYILLALILLKCVFLYKIYHSIPVLELKRRAKTKDKKAAGLYKVAAYQEPLDTLLWLLGTISAAILFIWSARTNWWLASVVIILAGWLVVWARISAEGWAGSMAAVLSPYHARFLSLAHPLLSRITKWLPPGRRVYVHTGLYEKRDLLEFINKQNKQLDNRIPESDLRIVHGSLTFGDKTVGSLMTPRRQIKLVSANDAVGPMLMDELHKSGHSRLPVVKDSAKSASPEVIGTLYLNDLIGYEGGGKVKDLAKHDVFFINEEANLRQALSAFLKTHHHLLIVVNSFEELVGVLSIEDVLEQIIGKQILDEFDGYANLRAVAAMDAQKDQAEHNEVEPEQTQETVVK